MVKMSTIELQEVYGGSISGALLGSVGGIIDAATNFVTSIAGIAFAWSGPHDYIKGDFKFNKNMSFSWDNTKLLQNHDIQTIKLEGAYDQAPNSLNKLSTINLF